MVHYEALTDLRALRLLESLTSKEHVMDTFLNYLPASAESLAISRFTRFLSVSRYISDFGYLLNVSGSTSGKL